MILFLSTSESYVFKAACSRSGEYSHAIQLFVDMKTDRIACDIVVYNALVSAFATSGKSDLVSKT